MAFGSDCNGRRVASPARDAQAYRRRTRASQRQNGRRAGSASRQPTRRRPARRRPLLRIAALVAAAVAVLGIVFFLRSCRGARIAADAARTEVEGDALFASPYDWSNLSWSEAGRATYAVDGAVVSRQGIDVSEHQGWIDWGRVAADGIDFAIVRVGYRSSTSGNLVQDDYAEYNLRSVPAAGLDLGVYFYSQATTTDEAREEADFVLNLIRGQVLAYPVVFDFEPGTLENERIAGMTSEERTQVAVAFCERIEEAGLSAMVYGNAWNLGEIDATELASRGFWYAEYATHPTTNLRFALWQYAETGTVAGIDGAVDLDLDLTAVWADDGAEEDASSDDAEASTEGATEGEGGAV